MEKYIIYATNSEMRIDTSLECADIDDMTDNANALLYEGYKEVKLVIND